MPDYPHTAAAHPGLLDRLRLALQIRGRPPGEVDAAAGWVRRFAQYHRTPHPERLGGAEVGAFLTHLAADRGESLPALAQARRALLFLYRDFLHRDPGPVPVTWARPGRPPSRPPLLDDVRRALRVKHYALSTEHSYVNWVRRFVLFHGKRHPVEMGGEEVSAFLTHLAVGGRVSASTQNQALAALLFLYEHVLRADLGPLDAVRARRPAYLPVVLSRDEVRAVLARVDGAGGLYSVVARLLYGAGLRVTEGCRVRVREIDLDRGQVFVRGGKWHSDRVVMLPRGVRADVEAQLARRREVHDRDLSRGLGWVADTGGKDGDGGPAKVFPRGHGRGAGLAVFGERGSKSNAGKRTEAPHGSCRAFFPDPHRRPHTGPVLPHEEPARTRRGSKQERRVATAAGFNPGNADTPGDPASIPLTPCPPPGADVPTGR